MFPVLFCKAGIDFQIKNAAIAARTTSTVIPAPVVMNRKFRSPGRTEEPVMRGGVKRLIGRLLEPPWPRTHEHLRGGRLTKARIRSHLAMPGLNPMMRRTRKQTPAQGFAPDPALRCRRSRRSRC